VTVKRTVVKVTVAGQELTVRSDVSAEHARAIAEYVDRAIRRAVASGPGVDTHRAALLAALQAAGELFQLREHAEELRRSIERLSAEVREGLGP
jgi:cell division protein ZapA (FtsZ GTPase activity inhibitor)